MHGYKYVHVFIYIYIYLYSIYISIHIFAFMSESREHAKMFSQIICTIFQSSQPVGINETGVQQNHLRVNKCLCMYTFTHI